ncbi:MAG TPA: DUF4139 domain-containing protein [Candidatus Sulfotelmatobacter sp.]|nr:DUF4139 domain-containing protein [Candidatus Sulfotelmatobacter sp.]
MSPRTMKLGSAAILAALVLLLPLAGKLSRVQAAPGKDEPAAKQEPATTTEKDQFDVAVTVYNSNLALVRDSRQIHLPSGSFPLRFEDVAATINPATVHFRSLTDAAKLSILEQNYEYDLLDPQKLLNKYVGREIPITYSEGNSGWIQGKALLLADNGGPVWKIGDEIVTGISIASYHFPEIPGNLYSRPTLVWMLENRGAASQKVEASYLANSVNWNADYVLTVGRDEKKADLDGWVTLTNKSGAAYKNAKLQLVAGDVHRLPPGAAGRDYVMAASQAVALKAAPQFEQEGFGEYHLYTLERRTSIENNESKQISLLTGSGVPVEKFLLVESDTHYFRNPQGIGNPVKQPVKVYYRFKNDEKSSLGMPLPGGTIRVYQADSKGGTQFAGEDRIDHTPKDEKVKVYIGNAFDVVCERKQMDYKKIAGNVYELEYEIALRNHKDTAATVEVREPVGGDWQVLKSNYDWTKLDSGSIGFSIPVEKDGAATLTYRVRVTW